MLISSKIRYLREKVGYTQQQLANFLNIDRSTYAYYESGKTKPDIETIMKLSKIFNVPFTEFLESEHTVKLSDSATVYKNIERKKTLKQPVDVKKPEAQIEDMLDNEQKLIMYFRMFPQNLQKEIVESLFRIYKKIIDVK